MTRNTRILAGPQVDALRFGVLSPETINPYCLDMVRGFESRARYMVQHPEMKNRDIACFWPDPQERPGMLPRMSSNRKFMLWDRGSIRCLPKLDRSPVLADFLSGEDGPGFLRLRDPDIFHQKYPYCVLLDLSSSWIWEHGDPEKAARAAVKWWADCEVLDLQAVDHIADANRHKITRVDIACDHVTSPRWMPEDYRYFATRSFTLGFQAGMPPDRQETTPASSCFFGPRSFTLYVGKRGSKSAAMWRIYDKTAWLSAYRPDDSDSAWFWHPLSRLWTDNGWNRKDKVWRAEIEIGSRALHTLDSGGDKRFSTFQGLDIPALWSHFTTQTRHTTSRVKSGERKTSKRWAVLQAAVPFTGKLARIKKEPGPPKLDAIREAIASAYDKGASKRAIFWEVRLGLLRGQERKKARDRKSIGVKVVQKGTALNDP